MVDPLFWLGLSLLLVAVSLTAVLMAAIPALRELGRASRSAEKLFDTLNRELPPTLEAIRLTGLEITELTDDVSEGVQQAGRVVQQVDQGLEIARRQAQGLNTGTRSVLAGAMAAWRAWNRSGSPTRASRRQRTASRPNSSSPPSRAGINAAAGVKGNRRKQGEAPEWPNLEVGSAPLMGQNLDFSQPGNGVNHSPSRIGSNTRPSAPNPDSRYDQPGEEDVTHQTRQDD